MLLNLKNKHNKSNAYQRATIWQSQSLVTESRLIKKIKQPPNDAESISKKPDTPLRFTLNVRREQRTCVSYAQGKTFVIS